MENNQEKMTQFPEGGTLGILAYGYKGILLWRQERRRIVEERIKAIQTKKGGNEKK